MYVHMYVHVCVWIDEVCSGNDYMCLVPKRCECRGGSLLGMVSCAGEAKRTKDQRMEWYQLVFDSSSTRHSKPRLARESEQCPRSPEQSSSKRRGSSQRLVSRRTGPKGEVGKDGWTTGGCRPVTPGTTSQCSCRPCPVPPSPHRCTIHPDGSARHP